MTEKQEAYKLIMNWNAEHDAFILPATTHAAHSKDLRRRVRVYLERPFPDDLGGLLDDHIRLLDLLEEMCENTSDIGRDLAAFSEILQSSIRLSRDLADMIYQGQAGNG